MFFQNKIMKFLITPLLIALAIPVMAHPELHIHDHDHETETEQVVVHDPG
tara:strand:- start:1267 stop:1416 length:150 start_codon:yes stop_codon:yes gene_type:complete